MISVNDLKTGLTLDIDNGLWSVVEFLHVKPGKGAAFVRTKLKNVETQINFYLNNFIKIKIIFYFLSIEIYPCCFNKRQSSSIVNPL